MDIWTPKRLHVTNHGTSHRPPSKSGPRFYIRPARCLAPSLTAGILRTPNTSARGTTEVIRTWGQEKRVRGDEWVPKDEPFLYRGRLCREEGFVRYLDREWQNAVRMVFVIRSLTNPKTPPHNVGGVSRVIRMKHCARNREIQVSGATANKTFILTFSFYLSALSVTSMLPLPAQRQQASQSIPSRSLFQIAITHCQVHT